MRCLPLNIYKEVYTFGTSILVCWFCKDTVKFHSINDQPSWFKFSPVTEVKYFEWIKNGSYERGYGKPHKVSYKIDGSVHIIDTLGVTKINEIKVRNMHRDYHDDWYEYLARFKRFGK